jgi:hypothetical protein
MKGIAGYLISIALACFLTIIVFYILGEILSREIEVSTISRKISSIINEAEYSKFYFYKYLKNKYEGMKRSGMNEQLIIDDLSKEAVLSLEHSKSVLKNREVFKQKDSIVWRGEIFYTYRDETIEMNFTSDVEFHLY